jgi:hypothetical protein
MKELIAGSRIRLRKLGSADWADGGDIFVPFSIS